MKIDLVEFRNFDFNFVFRIGPNLVAKSKTEVAHFPFLLSLNRNDENLASPLRRHYRRRNHLLLLWNRFSKEALWDNGNDCETLWVV